MDGPPASEPRNERTYSLLTGSRMSRLPSRDTAMRVPGRISRATRSSEGMTISPSGPTIVGFVIMSYSLT